MLIEKLESALQSGTRKSIHALLTQQRKQKASCGEAIFPDLTVFITRSHYLELVVRAHRARFPNLAMNEKWERRGEKG
jgi:hypothetical protein